MTINIIVCGVILLLLSAMAIKYYWVFKMRSDFSRAVKVGSSLLRYDRLSEMQPCMVLVAEELKRRHYKVGVYQFTERDAEVCHYVAQRIYTLATMGIRDPIVVVKTIAKNFSDMGLITHVAFTINDRIELTYRESPSSQLCYFQFASPRSLF